MSSLKGAQRFTAGDNEYVLSFSIAALCLLEDESGQTIAEWGDVLKEAGNLSAKTLALLFYVGLKDEQPEISKEQAMQLLAKIDAMAAIRYIMGAFTGAFPDAPAEATDAANPRKPGKTSAKNGTGPASIAPTRA